MLPSGFQTKRSIFSYSINTSHSGNFCFGTFNTKGCALLLFTHENKFSKETLYAPDDRDYKMCINMFPLLTSILLTTLVFKCMQCAAKGQESWWTIIPKLFTASENTRYLKLTFCGLYFVHKSENSKTQRCSHFLDKSSLRFFSTSVAELWHLHQSSIRSSRLISFQSEREFHDCRRSSSQILCLVFKRVE